MSITLEQYGELKDCPFCGSSCIAPYRNGNNHYLYCEVCGASSRHNLVNEPPYVVAYQWNMRRGD